MNLIHEHEDYQVQSRQDWSGCTCPARTIGEWKRMAKTVWATPYDFSKQYEPVQKRKRRTKYRECNFSLYIKRPTSDGEKQISKSCSRKRRLKLLQPEVQPNPTISTRSKMQVFVKTPLSTTLNLTLQYSTSVATVKGIIRDKLGIADEKQELFFGRLKMCDLLTLKDHGVKDECNISLNLCPGLLGGADKPPDAEKSASNHATSLSSSLSGNTESSKGCGAQQPSGSTDKTMIPISSKMSVKELKGLASELQVDITGYWEKSDLVAALRNAQQKKMKVKIEALEQQVADQSAQMAEQNAQMAEQNAQMAEQNAQMGVLIDQNAKLIQAFTEQKSVLARFFAESDIGKIDRVSYGSIYIFVRFSKRQQLEKLWQMYENGNLQIELTNIILARESQTDEERANSNLKVSVDQDEYLRGIQHFDQVGDATQPAEIPMQEWSSDKLRDILLQEGISQEIVNKFHEEEIDGNIFADPDSDFQSNFKLKKGPLMKLQRIRKKYLALSAGGNSTTDRSPRVITGVDLKESAASSAEHLDPYFFPSVPQQLTQGTGNKSGARPKTDQRKTVDEGRTRGGSLKDVEKRLRRLLLGDEKYTLDESYYPVLVANEPPNVLLSSEARTVESLSFITDVDWKVVFDFYAHSNTDGLCRYFSDTRKPNLQLPETVDTANLSYLEDVEDPLWLFCNGREDDTNIVQPVLSRPKWNEERSKDVEEVIGFIAKQCVIPSPRSVIVFLILSENDIGILSDTFRKCFSAFHGMDNITCIVGNTELYTLWKEEVQRWCGADDLQSRSVVGIPLTEINRMMTRMSRFNITSDKKLPLGGQRSVYLAERDAQKWKDISVVCQNECENTDMNEDHPEFEAFSKGKELQLYKGHKPDWWNFELTDNSRFKDGKGYNHVLRRASYDKLQSKINSALQGSLSQDLIITITMFHQPGCGASTLARHQLWGFHKEYRCIYVDRVTSNTAKQILDVRKYKYPDEESCLPVLVLADDLEDAELTELISDLENLSRDMIVRGVLCVLLHCKRTPNPQELLKRSDKHLGFTLQQELDMRERDWFQQKYEELEWKEDILKSGDYKPEKLIAFMVMKEECNPKYVSKVVSEVLVNVLKHSTKEYQLLKYAAVLNSYMGDAAIPVSCCDEFMLGSKTVRSGGYARYTAIKKSTPWEKSISPSSQMLLIKVQVAGIGHVHGIKIVHRCVAEEIVRQISDEKDQSLADITLEFIHSDLLQSVSSREYLASEMHDLLIRRKKYELGDNEETQFSPLIEQVYGEDKQKALEVLETGHEVLSDHHYAQQAARLCYILEKDYTKAHEYIRKAIDQRPKNAYIWDTKGQIYRSEIKEKYTQKYQAENKILSIAESMDLIKLAMQAIEMFKKAQELRPSTSNISTFFSEVDISFMLIQVIDYCIPVFRASGGRQKLKAYLITEAIPEGLEEWASFHQFLKGLKTNIDVAMQEMDNYLTFCKDASSQHLKAHELDLKRRQHQKLHNLYVEYFGEALDARSPQNAADLPDWRRRQVSSLGADNFHRIFELGRNRENVENRKKLATVIELLSQNTPFTYFDLRNLICAILALSTFGIYEMVRELKDKGANIPNELYGRYFLLMFMWPHPGDDTHRIKPPQKLSTFVNDLKSRWDKQWDHPNDSEEERAHIHGKIKRHKSGRRKPLTFFFLAEGRGLSQFAHINEFNATQSTIFSERDRFWEKEAIQKRLTRLRGTLYNNILLSYTVPTGEQLYIRLSLPKTEVESQEPVTFYLGFSWGGPVAYNVRSADSQMGYHRPTKTYNKAYPRYLMIHKRQTHEDLELEISRLEKKKEDMQRHLEKLRKFDKKKKEGGVLTADQVRKLKKSQTNLRN
ncbi:sterile alpha motif domain-containing protein 9-like [Amphiura filiformis]|uniref:sterile alpha motif domain-containing protein 9-like n=1 Tax=Amphiura filiformis TaxID=82378 RepID=UPI003B213D8B